MTDILSRILRAVLFAVLALIGMAMAVVFMVSTAIAVGILYVVAKVRGKPFGVRAYWSQRQSGRSSPFQQAGGNPFQPKPPRNDIIDVEVREVR